MSPGLQRIELRRMTGETPNISTDPVYSTDFSLPEGKYSFNLTMNDTGTFKFYSIAYDVAGNVSNVSEIVTVKVESESE